MYLKLSLRSALRDRRDYQLYTLTLTVLTGVMTLAQMAAALGDRAGLETASLPLLVGLILVVLLRYVSRFILRQRAQEFALYLLMGMERRHLAWMFFLEFFLLGCLCLAGGIFLGAGMGCCLLSLSPERGPLLPAIGSAAAETAGYFLAVQLVSLVSTAQLIRRLEIRELTAERASDRSWNLGPGRVWAAAAGVSFAVLAAALLGIAFAPGAADMLVGLVSLPALALVFCFYRALYALLSGYRRRGGRLLLRGDRLFLASQLLSGGAQSALLDSVLCLCLLLAAAAFLCGGAMLSRDWPGMDPDLAHWMGFLQAAICVIFLVIYFAVLSLRQAVDAQYARRSVRILRQLGRSGRDIRGLLARQTCLRFALPLLLCLPLLALAVPLAGFRLSILPLAAALCGGFLLCFGGLWGLYAWTVCRLNGRMAGD